MTRAATGRVRSLAIVGGMSLLLALALGVPEVAAIGAGAAVLLVVGLLTAGEAMMELSVDAGQVRVVEGEPVRIMARLATDSSVVVWLSARWADGDRLRGILAAGKGHPKRQRFHRRADTSRWAGPD